MTRPDALDEGWTGGGLALTEIVERLAHELDAWVLVDEFDRLLAHAGVGASPPPSVVEAIVHRDLRLLRAELSERSLASRGVSIARLHGVSCAVVDVGPGQHLWILGPFAPLTRLRAVVPAVKAALEATGSIAVSDPELQHRLGTAAAARHVPQVFDSLLAVARGTGTRRSEARTAAALLGQHARVHEDDEHDCVVVLLPVTAEPLLKRLIKRDITAGVVGILNDQAGLREAYATARVALADAVTLGTPCSDARQTATAARLVARSACEAASHSAAALLPDLMPADVNTDSLLVWARHGWDSAAAAAELGIHQNTLRYRTRAAAAAHRVDLESPLERLVLQLIGTARRDLCHIRRRRVDGRPGRTAFSATSV